MGWLGISILCALVALAWVHYKERAPLKMWWYSSEYVGTVGITLVMSLALVGIIGGIHTGTVEGRNTSDPACEQWVNTWDIVTAVRDKQTSGSFILGTGGIHQVDRYYVYRVDPEGLMLVDYNAHRTYVVERDGPPQYERIDYICPLPIYDFLWWSTGNTHRNIGKKGTLYVPPGTVLREFRM